MEPHHCHHWVYPKGFHSRIIVTVVVSNCLVKFEPVEVSILLNINFICV